ncbi:hypothetical protein M5D96_009354 [Drosophila gunungcola]|uniref:Uncharacterized protein n=1 Tax=Drosophila gunungcola TaxID=103775 RepID=A0A9P9YJP4_9MUSC|nr:hypothetical protein M5D96_009354 [Drosophila gunungcola]
MARLQAGKTPPEMKMSFHFHSARFLRGHHQFNFALNPSRIEGIQIKGCEPKRVPFSIFAKATQHAANLENLVPRHWGKRLPHQQFHVLHHWAADSPFSGEDSP